MSARELIVLGTASQAPTRYRAHNSYALRWDDQLLLFDPGEGTQRQCILAGVAIARATAVCITHFHGDHCLGLPGVIQRRALDSRSVGPSGTEHAGRIEAEHPGLISPSGTEHPGAEHPGAELEGNAGALPPLPVFFPADGQEYFDRMRKVSIFHDTSGVVARPISESGPVGILGAAELSAIALDHRVTTFGFRLTEPDGRSFDQAALSHFGISGPDVGRLGRDGSIETEHGTISIEQVSHVRRGQSMAFVMDTAPCDAVLELAADVDLLVCESTFLDTEAELADRYRHLTARQAGEMATAAGARRLVLTHFSARYPDNQAFADEAGSMHPDVVAAEDLAVIEVPGRS